VNVFRRIVPHALRAHPLASVLVVAVLVGGGLRFVPASVASSGQGASTACAAQ
jgi:hypothetical protein